MVVVNCGRIHSRTLIGMAIMRKVQQSEYSTVQAREQSAEEAASRSNTQCCISAFFDREVIVYSKKGNTSSMKTAIGMILSFPTKVRISSL